MKPKLNAKPSFTTDDTDRRSRGPEEDDGVVTLSKAALLVRRIYIDERTRYETTIKGMTGRYVPKKEWDGTTTKQTDGRTVRRSQRPAWEQLAEFVVENKIDPHAYLAAVFADLRINERVPTPYNLSGDDMLDRWLEIRKGCEKNIELSFRIETKLALKKITYWQVVMSFKPERATRTTLVDDTLGLSPLFRHCLAYAERHDDIADHFYEAAVMQFMQYETFYKRHWVKMLPKGFAAEAVRAYREFTEVRRNG